tara:strand:+ start:318 stop:2189 length:1872 start_codon:yes stop_codon:yes gene_type:complete
MLSVLALIFLLKLVSAGYPTFTTTSTHPLVVCAGLDAAYASLDMSGTFPDALVESNCVAIDVCAEINNRGESVPSNTWLHRSQNGLVYDGEYDLASAGVYNYFNIEYARVPAGINLELCAPNFGHYRLTGEYICDNVTLSSVQADCPPISYVGSSFDLTECISAVQYDKEGEFQAALYGTTQMLRYSFYEDWGCLTSADVSAGIQLSSTTKPNTLIPCPDIPHAIYNIQNGCEFTCEHGYTKGVGVCNPECVAETETECAADERVSSQCDLMTPSRFACEQCPVQAGKRTLPWQSSTSIITTPNPAVCDETNGWISVGNRCVKAFTTTMSWHDAKQACITENAELVLPQSDLDSAQLVALFAAEHDKSWIGAVDEDQDNVWLSSTGNSLTYTNWCDGNGPDNPDSTENCARFQRCIWFGTNQCDADYPPCWSDRPCSDQHTYICEKAGLNAVATTTSRKTTCLYENCPAGTHSSGGSCVSCSVNFVSLEGADECQQCSHGSHQPETGKSSCVECFSETVDTTDVCADGEMLVRNVTVLDEYYSSLDEAKQNTYDLFKYCADSYACLPCKPGFKEVSHTCESCVQGKYQPNFKMTECFECSNGQTTTSVGSVSSAQCVCREGFE